MKAGICPDDLYKAFKMIELPSSVLFYTCCLYHFSSIFIFFPVNFSLSVPSVSPIVHPLTFIDLSLSLHSISVDVAVYPMRGEVQAAELLSKMRGNFRGRRQHRQGRGLLGLRVLGARRLRGLVSGEIMFLSPVPV